MKKRIEANSEKANPISDMPSPKIVKEV